MKWKYLYSGLEGIFCSKKIKEAEKERGKGDFAIWDMHCHILPGVDDGAESMSVALWMIEKEIEEGITNIMLTPHYVVGRTDSELIHIQYERLKDEIKQRELPVQLYLGNELLYSANIVQELKEGRALTLEGTSYVLVEFSIDIPYQTMKYAFHELLLAGYRPVLAHLERYQCLLNKRQKIDELIEQGVLMQVNSNSFFHRHTSLFLMELARKGEIHFIGTDCHSIEWRPPAMKKTIRALEEKLDSQLLRQLLIENPNKLIKNEYI